MLASINIEVIVCILIFVEANGWLLIFFKKLENGEKLDVNLLFGLIKISRSLPKSVLRSASRSKSK